MNDCTPFETAPDIRNPLEESSGFDIKDIASSPEDLKGVSITKSMVENYNKRQKEDLFSLYINNH